MAGVKVTDLPAIASAASTDVMYIVDTAANQSRKIEVGDVVNLQTAYDNGSTINTFNIVLDATDRKAIIGYSAASGLDSVCIGYNANGDPLTSNVTAIGSNAASQNAQDNVTAIGFEAGYQQSGTQLTAIGISSAKSNTGNEVLAIGNSAGFQNTGSNVVAIGTNAAQTNTLSNMFVISPNHLPSYADSTAAAAAITTGAGATSGNYYLYHDQSDGTIKAIIP